MRPGIPAFVLVAASIAAAGQDNQARPAAASSSAGPICHSCFWRWFPELKDEVIDVYRRYECKNTFCKAEVAYLLGTVLNEPARVASSYPLYAATLEKETDPARRMLLNEI